MNPPSVIDLTVAANNRQAHMSMAWHMVDVLSTPSLNKLHKLSASHAWAAYMKAALT